MISASETMKSLVQSEYTPIDEELDYPKTAVIKTITEQHSLPPIRETHSSTLLLQQTLQNRRKSEEPEVSAFLYIPFINADVNISCFHMFRSFSKCQNLRKYPQS